MNNPGIDLRLWEQLKKKWTELDAKEHRLKIEFQLIADPDDKSKILAIDIVQYIDGNPVTETVQRNAGEAYVHLGIAGLSLENLVSAYKEMLREIHPQANRRDTDLVVTMSPSSLASGEVRAYIKRRTDSVQSSILVNYRHYYFLNALRDKMIEMLGEGWTQVRTVFHFGNVEFYFEY